MEVAKSGRKKTDRNLGHQDLVGPKRNRYRHVKSIEENEKIVEEMQQQILRIERKITEKKLVHEKATSRLNYNLRYRWSGENDEHFQSDCPKKMVLDKLTFANGAYRDNKAVLSFSSGEREINIHNLNHRMLHEAHSMDGERRILKMLNPNNDIDYGISLKQVEQQMGKLYYSIKWPQYNSSTNTNNGETNKRTLKELEWKRDQMFVNAPSKASLWNALPSTKDLRIQIQAVEARDEEKRKMVLKASLVCSLGKEISYWNETEIEKYYQLDNETQQYPLESGGDLEDDYDLSHRSRRLFNPDFFKILKSMRRNRSKPPPRVDPSGIVTIKLDIMNKTYDSYMANVTIIFEYLEKQHIEGPWDLKWTWNADEILLSTVGAKGIQHSYVSTGDHTCCLNSVTIVDLPPQIVHDDQRNIPNCSENGLIPPWLEEADLAKSSCSFQISVSQASLGEHASPGYHAPPLFVTMITQGLKYMNCGCMGETITTRGYESTWKSKCYLFHNRKKLHEIHNKQEL
ncbi:hypothetical protein AALP_AA1G118700 [Arabis alpina]|uniref:Uncharacterized protein n=1 Tax=Arabis alpina TaxID=50452 RepID=A0A087HMM9_ARAAL|nr:hypothetical protein AALP_AA1G118700 [Arabis alpina]